MKSALRSATLFWRQRNALPQTLIFFVTSRCNARCDFCLYYEQISRPTAREQELTVEEVEQVAERYGPLHCLALSGGEPFVRRDLEPLCQAFIDRCGTMVVDIPSNFYFTDAMVAAMEPLARNNPNVVFDMQMSVDHVGEAHDESRKVPGLYRQAIESARALARIREHHPNLKLKGNIVWLDRNKEDLDEIVSALSQEVELDRLQVSYPNLASPDPGLAEDVATFAHRAEAVSRRSRPRDRRDLHTLGVRSVEAIYHRLLARAVEGRENVGSYCEAGRHVVVLDEKGEVFPCEPLWHSVGNVREHGYDLGAVLEGSRYREFRERHLGPGKCNCSWSCAILGRISVNPAHLPEIGIRAAGALLRP